jgi:hypothetical protein
VTYGELKFRLVKAFPGVDLTLIEGWIGDVYADILGELPWSRQKTTGILRTTAPYTTGAASVTSGSASVSLSGGTWTSLMSGRAFRIGTRDEYYQFTQTGSTTGTLDRAYEGDTDTSASYRIFQFVYPLPSDCRLLQDDAFPSLIRTNGSRIDAWADGTPTRWASYMEDSSTPPRMQVELYPAPDAAIGIPFTYIADAALSGSTSIVKAWLEPSALVEGVTAKIKAHLKDYNGALFHQRAFRESLDSMKRAEAHGSAPCEMRLDSYFTRHRRRRVCR